MIVADSVLQRPKLWEMQRIHGYPGDGIDALLDAVDLAVENGRHLPGRDR